MGTKNNPGKFDCYSNAEPDEPMFILLGRDPMAGRLVREWAAMRAVRGEDPAKVIEAVECAHNMDAWAHSKGKEPIASDDSTLRDALKDLAYWAKRLEEAASGTERSVCMMRLVDARRSADRALSSAPSPWKPSAA